MASEQTVPFPERRVRHRARRGPPEFKAERPAYPPLPTGLEGLFQLVSAPVLKLEKAPRDQLTLREISIVLGDILDLLEEDRSIIRAADRLYGAALALQDATEKHGTCMKITRRTLKGRSSAVHLALADFRENLRLAKPNARGRARRLEP